MRHSSTVMLVRSQMIAAQAANGTTGVSRRPVAPPVPSGARRPISQAARQQPAYSSSVARFARIARRSNPLVIASAQTRALWVTIARCGVWNRGCTRPSARGR